MPDLYRAIPTLRCSAQAPSPLPAITRVILLTINLTVLSQPNLVGGSTPFQCQKSCACKEAVLFLCIQPQIIHVEEWESRANTTCGARPMEEHEPIDMRRNENAALAHCAEHALWASMNRWCQSEAEAQMTYSPLPPSSNKPPLAM